MQSREPLCHSFFQILAEELKDPEFRRHYDVMKDEFDGIKRKLDKKSRKKRKKSAS